MLLNTYVKLRNKLSCKKGQGFVEYLILVVLVAVGLITVIYYFRDTLIGRLEEVTDRIGGMG